MPSDAAPPIVLMNQHSGPWPEDDRLDLRNISGDGFSRIVTSCRAKWLRLGDLTAKSLDGIEELRDTTELLIEWAPKVESIEPVFRMGQLHSLSVIDVARLRDISGIGRLSKLRSLTLEGGVWKPLRLNSLKPVADLPGLQHLRIMNVRLADDDVTCLSRLAGLRSLELSNQFEREQIAALAHRFK